MLVFGDGNVGYHSQLNEEVERKFVPQQLRKKETLEMLYNAWNWLEIEKMYLMRYSF